MLKKLKNINSGLFYFLIPFLTVLVIIFLIAVVLVSPFALIGYIFYLLIPFFKDLYRIRKNFKYDKTILENARVKK